MRLFVRTCCGLGAMAVAVCGSVWAQEDTGGNSVPAPAPDKIAEARELVDALAHRDPNIRQAAASAIQGLDNEPLMAAVGALVGVIERGDEPYAIVAGSTLIEIDLSAATRKPVQTALVQSLYDRMKSGSLSPRRWAIAAQLIRTFAPETAVNHVEIWAEGLRSPDEFRTYEAVTIIEFVTSRSAAESRQAAMERIDARPKSERTKAEANVRSALQAANARRQKFLDARAMFEPALMNLLHQPRIRFTEVELDASVIPVGLTGYIRRNSEENRLLVLRTLIDLEADPALLTTSLLRAMDTANQYAAVEAATLIGILPGESAAVQSLQQAAVAKLVQLAGLPGGRVRGVAAGEIGGLENAAITVLPQLIAMLRDSDADVRTGAARSLGNLGPKAKIAIPALREAIKVEGLVSKLNVGIMQDALKSIDPAEKKTETQDETL